MSDFDDLLSEANTLILDTFSTEVLLANNKPIRGEFDIPTEEVNLRRLQLDSPRPVLTVDSFDADKLQKNDTIHIKGKPFDVLKKLPDGSGFTVIHLSEHSSTNAEDWL